ncbi:MAG: ABC transporter permease [Planctomycetota bacterium]
MIKTIAIYEFLFAIKRPSYYLLTFGMPLIALAYFGLIMLIVLASVPSEISKMSKPVGVIDHSGFLTSAEGPLAGAEVGETIEMETEAGSELDAVPELEQLQVDIDQFEFLSKRKVMLLGDLDAAKSALENEEVQHVTVVPQDYLESGQFQVFVKRSQLLGASFQNRWIAESIAKQILDGTELDGNQVDRIRKSAASVEHEIGDNGEFVEVNRLTKAFSLGMPLAIAGLLVIALMMNAGLLLASIAEEKENKVMEVIVSSVSADHLLLGKVLGIVMAGLLQITVWMAMVSFVPMLSMSVLQETFEVEFNVVNLLVGGVFVLAGFVFYGCLLAGLGSLGSNYKDCQQLSVAVILCACVPFMVPTVFINNSNGLVAQVLSMVPLFSPVAMMGRLGCGDVPWWEVGLSFAILLASIYFAIKIAAKLFRVGTLMQGKRPGPFEIWKVLTQPS